MTLPPFPVDDMSLDLLAQAVGIDPGAERSSLHATLDMLSTLGGADLNAVEEEHRDIQVMRDAAYSVNDCIAALIEEIRRLRWIGRGSPRKEV